MRLPFLSRPKMDVSALFSDLAMASRNPAAFRDWGVADDFEGRFERLALAMTMVLRRLKALPPPADLAGQELVDHFFAHLDDGLRRSGIGDLSVGKKVKKMAQGFYGRAEAYTAALDEAEPAPALRLALARNLYGSQREATDVPAALIAEIESWNRALAAARLENLLAGSILAGRGNA
jgi:cytochrome b pre-mRNA-processing protein 3